jgi:sulfonate transport system substrate-binding protein
MRHFLQSLRSLALLLACASPVGAVTAALLADKLGLPAAVLERSEARTRYHALLPITPAVVAEQQGIADTFARLGIIPKTVQVSANIHRGVIPGL